MYQDLKQCRPYRHILLLLLLQIFIPQTPISEKDDHKVTNGTLRTAEGLHLSL
jgi:hypothetical protein